MENNQTPTPSVIPTSRDPESPNTNPIKPASKSSLKLIIGIIIFLLLAGGAAASFTIFKPQIVSLVTKPTPTILPTPSPSVIPTSRDPVSPTANWKIYENKEYGFSLKYPQNWQLDNEKELVRLKLYPNEFINKLSPNTPTIAVDVMSKALSDYPTGNINQQGTDFITDWKNTTINEVIGIFYKTHQCAPQCTADTVLPIPNSNKTVAIRISTVAQEKGYMLIYNQILSSFKFTN